MTHIISTTTVTTQKASGYLQQLCKHFGHKIEVVFSAEKGSLTFGTCHAELEAQPEGLVMRVFAENQEDIAKMQHVLGSHLERFAFREDLKFEWK